MRRILIALPLIAGLVPGALAAAPKFSAELPFRSCEGLICIDVALDGAAPRTLMLDIGNANSTLIADAARELSWTLEPAQRDGTAVPGIFIGGEHRVALGGMQASAPFFVFERALLGEYKPPVDGSLAYGFFKDRVLQVDYPHRLLRISEVLATLVPEQQRAAGSLKLIAFGDGGAQVVVGSPFTVNGQRVQAQIDTVFTGTMLIYDSAAARLGLTGNGTPELFRYTGGGVNLAASSVEAIGFGKTVVLGNKPTVYFPGEGKNPVHQPDGLFDATVGNALFAHSVVTMDFHAMTLDVKTASD